jgi:hypothetical protein
MPADQRVSDETWLRDAGKRGEVILMKDKLIRKRVPEIAAMRRFNAKCFCLTSGNLTGQQMTERFIENRSRIEEAALGPGPFIYAVRSKDIVKLRI